MTCAAALSCCHPPPLLPPLSRSYFLRSKDIQIPLPTSLSAANVALTNFQRAPWSSFFSLCCRSAPTASNSHGDSRRTLPLSKGTWSVATCLMGCFFFGRLFPDSFVSKGDWTVVSRPRRRKVLQIFQGKHANCRVLMKAVWLQGMEMTR